jgi:hypothetical protein
VETLAARAQEPSQRGDAEYLDGKARIIPFLKFCEHLKL